MMRKLIAAAAMSFACVLHTGEGMEVLAAPATHTVVMSEMKFAPETLTVKRGDTIVWVNKDFFPHTATAQDRSFDSKDLGTNKTWKYIANKAGTFSYICTLHPMMTATLIVK
jgi:plastocyanin